MASKPNSQKQYPLKYDEGSDLGRWMQVQKNKSRSLGYLIDWAIANFGEVDLIDASMKQTFAKMGAQSSGASPETKIDVPAEAPPVEPVAVPTNKIEQPQPNVRKNTTNTRTRDNFKPVTKNKKPGILDSML